MWRKEEEACGAIVESPPLVIIDKPKLLLRKHLPTLGITQSKL